MIAGKTIVLTGCLQGIGKKTLKVFAEHGANVIACAYQENDDFVNYIKDISDKNHVKVIPMYMDLRDNDSIKGCAKKIMELKLEINGLVNIAGINRDAFLNMITYDDLRDTFQVNVFSQIIFTQYIVKLMQRKRTQGCSIVFTSSLAAIYGSLGQIAYSASKAALIGTVKSMAIELGKNGIRVNAIAPGVIKSPMTENLPEELVSARIKEMDIPRLGEDYEVANLLMFLMSNLSQHINGQIIRIDGGM